MDREKLEQIAKQLDGTNDSLATLLSEMNIDTDPRSVEVKLERKLSFGYCHDCEMWSDGVRNDQCDLCRS